MIRLPVTLAALAFIASGATAATTPAKPATAAKPIVAAKPATPPAKPSMFSRLTNAMSAKPAPAAKPAVHHASAAVANGRMVTTKTSTGKTITYNCSKAGNANKKACS